MIPAAALSLAAAGGVTLSVSEDADDLFTATATYAYAGGTAAEYARAETPREAASTVLDMLCHVCSRHSAEWLMAAEQATTEDRFAHATRMAAVWQRRGNALRSVRLAVLAAWPEGAAAGEVSP